MIGLEIAFIYVLRCFIKRFLCGGLLLLLPGYCPLIQADEWIIEGADRALAQNLTLYLDDIAPADARQDPEAILTQPITSAAQALGYYHLRWSLTQRRRDTVIEVQPGARVVYRNVTVALRGDGRDEKALKKFWRDIPVKPGVALHHGDYEAFKRSALENARSLGYLDARFATSSVRVDRDSNSADVMLALETGPAFSIDRVLFEGSRLDPDLLQRLSTIKSGDRFRAGELAQMYGGLYDSGYFDDINISQQPAGATQRDIVVKLKDAARHQIETGAGFSTDTGARVRLGWNRPALNRAGHQLQNDLKLAQKEQSFSSEYRIPLGNPLEHYVGINAGWRSRDIEDTSTEVFAAGVALHDKKSSGWHSRYGVEFNYEKYRQGAEPANEVFYTVPGIGWDYVHLQGPERMPDFGYKFWINTDASVPALGADASFTRVMLGAKWLNVFNAVHELQVRGEGGAISQSDIDRVPASRRFFTGGDQTVRGFSYLSLAPEDDTGQAIGGRYLNVASIEYRYRLRDDWHLAAFVDTGRAYSDTSDPFHTSIGVGLHWQTIVGPIRFDIATPIDDDEHKAVHLHVTMGPSL